MATDEHHNSGVADPRRLWDQARRAIAGDEPQRGRAAKSPVGRYLDAARHAREVAALRRLPHAIGPAARLASPGDWLSTQRLGVPILAVRGGDGVLRAFINVCRHRGALVAPAEGCGAGKARFVCPYHSWTYDAAGALVGRPHEGDFPHVPRAAAALVALPVAERCGLVWVVPEALAGYDWDDYFGPLARELEQLGYDRAAASPHERSFEQPSNWKLVLDANLESYHFQFAHRATIAHLFHDNLVQQASYGRHQRIVLPKRSLAEAPEGEAGWAELGRHSNIIYFFFPGTFLLWEGDHANVFNVTPAARASCATASWMLVPAAAHSVRAATHWERNWKIFWDAIDEDFALAASMQMGLASGANAALNFGTNEFACELFERAVEELIGGP
jgi:choline monooxygenase